MRRLRCILPFSSQTPVAPCCTPLNCACSPSPPLCSDAAIEAIARCGALQELVLAVCNSGEWSAARTAVVLCCVGLSVVLAGAWDKL